MVVVDHLNVKFIISFMFCSLLLRYMDVQELYVTRSSNPLKGPFRLSSSLSPREEMN